MIPTDYVRQLKEDILPAFEETLDDYYIHAQNDRLEKIVVREDLAYGDILFIPQGASA